MHTQQLRDVAIAVVIPAYRVANQIERVVSSIPGFVRHIVVVDDCSPDDTAARLAPLLSERVQLVRHANNQGVGGAMLSGYDRALELGAEIVVKIDGDDQMDPTQLPRLVAPIVNGTADYTKGNRFIHASELRRMPPLRKAGNVGLTFMTKLGTGYWSMFDPTNGYTAIHADVLRLLEPSRIDRGYFFETSMLFELRRVRAVVADVPMPARYGEEESSLSVGRVLFSFPAMLLVGLLRRLGRQYFLYDFGPASVFITTGLPMLLFGLFWGAAHWYISIATGKLATTGTVLLAVVPLILGFQLLVQALVLDIAAVPTDSVHRQVSATAQLVSSETEDGT